MRSIEGLIDKNGEDASVPLKEMLELIEHRGSDGCGAAAGTSIREGEVDIQPICDCAPIFA